jgi:hypothetical protein
VYYVTRVKPTVMMGRDASRVVRATSSHLHRVEHLQKEIKEQEEWARRRGKSREVLFEKDNYILTNNQRAVPVWRKGV